MLLSDLILEKIKPAPNENASLRAAMANTAAQQPLTSPASEQIGASADGDSSTGLVNGAAFPSLFGLAAESGLLTSSKDTLTLNLSPFDVIALYDRDVLEYQSKYEKDLNNKLRRLGLSLTAGGKGESFDRDGDGMADPALEAKELGDIVKWEAKWRFWGSRDRRDRTNVETFFAKTDVDALFIELNQALRDITNLPENREKVSRIIDEEGCIDVKLAEAFLEDPAVKAQLAAAAGVATALKAAVDAANREIDGSWIWSLVGSGTERGEEFGPDQWAVGVRGAKGMIENHGFTLNLDYTRTEGLAGLPDPAVWKLGAEYAILAFKNSFLSKDGVKVSFSAAGEKFEDVPTAKHDTNAKLNAKLDLPINERMKLPISVTWANHKDLLVEEDEIRGHIGFTIDLSKLKELKP